MHNLNESTVDDVIRLAANYHAMGELREAVRTVKEVQLWWGVPIPEREALTSFIRSRPWLEQYDLVVLYWAGESGKQPEDWDSAVEEARAEIDDPADYLAGKLHLEEFLRKGWGYPGE